MAVKIATFTELRNNAKKLFDSVERGNVIEVYRHGKPVALLSHIHKRIATLEWKLANPIKLKGVSLSKTILKERREK